MPLKLPVLKVIDKTIVIVIDWKETLNKIFKSNARGTFTMERSYRCSRK